MVCMCTGVCSANGSEDSVEALSEKMELTDFVIKPGMTCIHTVFKTRVNKRYSLRHCHTVTGPRTLATGTSHNAGFKPLVW